MPPDSQGYASLPPVAIHSPGVDLDRADLPGVEVHRAGELIAAFRRVTATDAVDRADDPVIAAGIVVDAGVQEFHSTPAEAVESLLSDRILGDVDGLLGGEGTGRTIATAVRKAIVAGGAGVIAAGSGCGVVATAPHEVEGIAFGSAIRIFNANDGDPAVAWFADQLLPAAPIDAGKAEIGRIGG